MLGRPRPVVTWLIEETQGAWALQPLPVPDTCTVPGAQQTGDTLSADTDTAGTAD